MLSHRKSVGLKVYAALALLSAISVAAPGDMAASQKIEETLNSHYLAMEFDKAEAALSNVIQGCAAQCSSEVIARAWMYIGLVRGVGKQNLPGAKDAFTRALAADPKVKLDEGLTTAEVKALFSKLGGSAAAAETPGAVAPSAAKPQSGGMTCTPELTEIQTRRSIPVSCTTELPALKAEIKYKEYGGTDWKSVEMDSSSGQWRGTIPCSATDLQGPLEWYVNAKDQSGEVIDQHGTQREPISVQVLENTTQPPPAYPDMPAPERCGASSECPEEMLGTPSCPGTVKPDTTHGSASAGESCSQSADCEKGLFCNDGQCEAVPSCDNDADCASGTCIDMLCQVALEESDDDDPASTSPLNWVGLHFAADLGYTSGTSVCTDSAFACYYSDGALVGSNGENFSLPNTDAGTIGGGFATGTLRVLASFERLLTPAIGLEARLGFAFGGAPASGDITFLPLHAELRGKYWLFGTVDAKPLSPYVGLGGGLAQVDTSVNVDIERNLTPSKVAVDAYKRMGTSFIALSGGANVPIGSGFFGNINVNAMFLMPKSGVVLEPSLGVLYGF